MKIDSIQNFTETQIINLLKNISNKESQFSNYLHWIIRGKYLIELRICWYLQDFKDNYSWLQLLKISKNITIQYYKEIKRELNIIRNKRQYAGI